MKKRLRAAALLAALALLLPAAGAGGARAASPEAPSAAQSALRAGSYGRYLAGIAEQPAGEAFTLKASAFTENPGGSASRLTEYKGGRDVLMVADQEDSLTYRLQVPRTGRYRVVFRYYPIKGNERPAELGLEVDGAVPFPGAERFTLGRVFTGETAIQKDAQGNEYAPRQVEHFDWFEEPLKLLDGTLCFGHGGLSPAGGPGELRGLPGGAAGRRGDGFHQNRGRERGAQIRPEPAAGLRSHQPADQSV